MYTLDCLLNAVANITTTKQFTDYNEYMFERFYVLQTSTHASLLMSDEFIIEVNVC